MKPELKLRDDQFADLVFMMSRPRSLILHDPGVGKTPPVCMLIWWYWREKQIRTAWPQPKSLLRKNRKELLDWTGLQPHDVVIVDGTPAEREAQMKSGAKVFLMGFQRWKDDWRRLREWYPDLHHVAIDEFHMGYATDSSARTQELYWAMKEIKHLTVMTGTIIKGRLSSAYPAIQLTEPGYYGTFGNFMMVHAIKDDYGTIRGWKNHAALSKVLAHTGIRRSFASVYGEEAKVILPEVTMMGKRHRELYDEWHEKAMLELQDEFLTAGNQGVHVLRARQIMAHPETFGFNVPDLGKDELLDVHLSDAKQSGERIVVFGSFIAEQQRIYEQVKKKGLRVGLINGTVSSKARGEVDELFCAGKLDCIVGSQDTAGVGYNWAFLETMINASINYNDDSFIQAYRRGIRGKRTTPLRIYNLEYEDSIDQRIFAIVNAKSRDANLVDGSAQVLALGGETPGLNAVNA